MEIAAFVLGIIALGVAVVTLPTAFQMWWGSPRIEVTFEDHDGEGWKALRCNVKNRPLDGRFLRRVGVVRQPTDVLADYAVSEAGSGKIVCSLMRAILKTDKETGKQVSVATYLPAIFTIVFFATGERNYLMECM